MKYCKHCGQEVNDDSVVCHHCGRQIEELQIKEKESSGLGVASIVFGALGGWIGLILGIIGLFTYKTEQNRKNSKIGIFLFAGWVVLAVTIAILIEYA